MNIPENYFEKLHGLYDEVKDAYENLNCMQSALDRKVSDIYHEIEKSEFDIVQGNDFAKQLKQTLQYRRVIKDELARLMPVYNMMKNEVGKVDEQYNRAIRKSYEIKESLNVTMGIEDVLAAVSVSNT